MKIQAKCQMVFAFLCVNLKIFYYTTFMVYIVERIPYLFYSPQSKKNSLFFFPFLKLVQINLIFADNRCTHGVYLTTSLQVLCYHTKSRLSIQNYPIIYLAHLTQRVMWGICHHLASIVFRKFLHFNLLLWNHWADWNQT